MIPLIETLEINIWLKLLIDATMKSFVILAVAGLFGFILRRHSAAVRALIWGLAILGCLVVPLFSFALPQWEVGVLPATSDGFEVDWLANNRQDTRSPVPIAAHPLASIPAASTQTTPIPVQPNRLTSVDGVPQFNVSETGFLCLQCTGWIAKGWMAGMLFLIVRLIVGIGAVWCLSVRSDNFNGSISQVQPDWKRPVSIRQSKAVTVPMVWGLFRPVILLPADVDEWEPERQRAVLLHELAHIQRQDWLMHTMAQITCAVYWFNPLVWFAARRMRTEIEGACDDHVLNAGYQSTDYAQHLVDIVRNIKKVGTATSTAVAMARPSKIEGRLRTILVENRNRRPLTRIAVAVGLLALTCFTVPIGVMQLAEAVGPEQALYQEIRAVDHFRLEPLPENATEAEQAARHEQYQQNWERGIQLCEEYLNTYLESDRYDEVFFKKLTYLFPLRHDAEFEDGVEAFLSEYPDSIYASKVRRLRAFNLEFQSKSHEALAEWDKIDDPALLLEVFQSKETIYAEMGNWEKVGEIGLLRAELILGKPAPEFSHKSVYGHPVSLKDLRGKVVVLYHWQDGIMEEDGETGWNISRLKQLHKTHGENPDFVLITICTESKKSKMKRFIKTHTMPGIHLLLEYETLPYQFGIDDWPHYVVIDKAGIIRESESAAVLKDLEVEHLVTALLAEDLDAPGDRVSPRISQVRAQLHGFQREGKKAITEYERLLDFMPNNPGFMWEIRYRKFSLTMEEFDRKRPGSDDDMTAWLNQVYDQIVEASQFSPSLGDAIARKALELASFYSHQGNRAKTWTLFQIAVLHGDINNQAPFSHNSAMNQSSGAGRNIALNQARQQPESFAAIQDMPEFQKIMAETPLTEIDKRSMEADRKRDMYWKDFLTSFKSFVSVKADGEIFTGTILSQNGHILVPAVVTDAAVIQVKIADYQPAKVVAVDSESGLAVVQVNGQTDLRPIILGHAEDLREYAPITLTNQKVPYTVFPTINVISTRGYPNAPYLPPEQRQQAFERPTDRSGSIQELEINDGGKVAALQAGTATGKIIGGDAFVYHDGRLLAVAVDSEVRYEFGSAITDPLPIDQIRAALKRMNLIDTIDNQIEKLAK